jgi:tetratricopeptide (TPR) repeat protein
MRIVLLFLIFGTVTTLCVSQPNCNVYKFNKNEPCYQACEESMKAIEYAQGSRESQVHFDKAIERCPSFDYAYFEKAVPYLKRGEFIEWKKLIDKAVELNPAERLGYRGWCRYQFLRDYKGAIQDLERLDSLVGYDIGYSANGDYHLKVALALCYKQSGQKQEAHRILEEHVSRKDYTPMPYDFLHLGVIKLELKDFAGAIAAFEKQIRYNDFQAENYYYMALAYKGLRNKNAFHGNLVKAKEHYRANKHLVDPYTHQADRIFLSEIEALLKKEGQ